MPRQSDSFGNRVHRSLIVATRYDDFFNPGSVKCFDRFDGVRADCVGDGENSQHFAFAVLVRFVADDEKASHAGVSLLRRQLVGVSMIPARACSLADRKPHLVALPGGDLVARVTVHSFRSKNSVPMENQWLAMVVLNPRGEFLNELDTNGRARHSAVDGGHRRGVTGPDGEIHASHREGVPGPVGRQTQWITCVADMLLPQLFSPGFAMSRSRIPINSQLRRTGASGLRPPVKASWKDLRHHGVSGSANNDASRWLGGVELLAKLDCVFQASRSFTEARTAFDPRASLFPPPTLFFKGMTRFYSWTRDLHLYFGLFICPFVLVFAVSTLLLNHPGPRPSADSPRSTPTKRAVQIKTKDGVGTLEQARNILRQLDVTGEIDYIRHLAKEERLLIPVTKPGEVTTVEVDLKARTATVQRQPQGLGATLIYLHKMPGPHNVKTRGNWIYTVWWSALADTVVYTVLFLTVSGLYLWWMLKAERAVGWTLLGAGVLSAGALVAALCSF